MTDVIVTKDVTIKGTELIGNKMAAIINEMVKLSQIPDSITSVVIKNDGHPKDAFGMAYADWK